MDSRSSGKYLGMVVGGSLSRGVDVRLDTQAQVEEMALGQHVVIHGKSRRFFGVITDVALESSDESLRGSPPDLSNPIVAQVVADTATYATLRVLPMLALEGALAAVDGPNARQDRASPLRARASGLGRGRSDGLRRGG